MLPDLVTASARAAEREIDAAYQGNLLLSSPYTTATWYALGVAEDHVFVPEIGGRQLDFHQLSALLDNLKFMLRYALHWLWTRRISDGQIPPRPDQTLYDAADDLLELAHSYGSFVAAYSLASRGSMALDADTQKRRLIVDLDLQRAGPYEAYDRIVAPSRKLAILERREHAERLDELVKIVDESLRVSSEGFRVNVNPRMVDEAAEFLGPLVAEIFSLPEQWRFSRYSIGDFRAVYTSLASLGIIQNLARSLAAGRGSQWLGFFNCLLVFNQSELTNRLTRYSGRDHGIVAEIVFDLTYGSQGQEKPDPALQPFLLVTPKTYLVSPMVVTSTAAERNLLALLNRIPAERAIYLTLVDEKQILMRRRIAEAVRGKPWRTWSGSVPERVDLPDVDLAIISDKEKQCLMLEMKWFIDPAEVREVLEKSEEIVRGVEQQKLIRDALTKRLEALRHLTR